MFKNTALGATYHVTPLTRVAVDYIFRKTEIPNPNAIGIPCLRSCCILEDAAGLQFGLASCRYDRTSVL